MENILFQERQYMHRGFILIFIFTFILTLGILAKYVVIDLDFSMSETLILAVVLLLELIFITNFFALKLKITDLDLQFGFGFFKKKIGLANIESVEISEYKFSNYMGYGIRIDRDKSIGYVARGGKGILISVKNDNRKKYFISSSLTDQIYSILKQKINQ